MENRENNIVVLSMGDPGGIGPEVVIKALNVLEGSRAIVVGDIAVLREAAPMAGMETQLREITSVSEALFERGVINVVNLGVAGPTVKCRATAEGGRASAAYIEKAAQLVMQGQDRALVTAPISKEALNLAGIGYPGHTEMLAHLTGTTDYAMMLVGGPLRVILVTTHTALKNVPGLITRNRVLSAIRLAARAARMLSIDAPKITVAGLNPHAGEAGLFGDEEIVSIATAVADAVAEGIGVTGPHPPDTIFTRAYKSEVDVVVCMYHDQGLIPLKMIAFDRGVNLTIGLPIVRTSPDHGTAYDIAWQGVASPGSMVEAIRMAERMRP
ncbi:MAG: 4-hydroxythreonine-4-phosphate dehydrogenase PdxA [Nitrospirae bacterium]|nr:4-hydroxythreonine-4-phosphate dehydrogenase PdxA [Nitrospirota bacterium]